MLTIELIRQHLQDYPARNYLLDEDEFSDEEIEAGLRLAQEGFNVIPPLHIRFTRMARGLDDLMLEGTLSRMYRGKAYQQARNELNFQDGTAAGSIDNKFQYYMQVSQTMWQEFERRAQQVKKYLNISDGYGGLGSEYRTLPDY